MIIVFARVGLKLFNHYTHFIIAIKKAHRGKIDNISILTQIDQIDPYTNYLSISLRHLGAAAPAIWRGLGGRALAPTQS